MKGIVFSEFIEMVETDFSPEIADEIIVTADLASGGMYTSVGTYDHGEMLELVARLSEKTNTPIAVLVQAFGRHLFGRFVALYPAFFEGVNGTFDFLSRIEDHVHVEVCKLYPDAELPTFETNQVDVDRLDMVYRSRRPFADLAAGLIDGCISYYGEDISVTQTDLSEEGRTHVHFDLRRR